MNGSRQTRPCPSCRCSTPPDLENGEPELLEPEEEAERSQLAGSRAGRRRESQP